VPPKGLLRRPSQGPSACSPATVTPYQKGVSCPSGPDR
jgi:hypothetical protein